MPADTLRKAWVTRPFLAALLLVLLFTTSRWQTSALVGDSLLLLGTILVGIAAGGRLWSSLYIAGYKTGRLVTSGPYAMCRNPLYLFTFFGTLGVGLDTLTFTFPLAIVAGFALYYPLVIRREEAKLLASHGDSYASYRRRTPAFLPAFSKLEEPKEYTVRPVAFRHQIVDAVWFIWALGVIELVETLHQQGVLPSLIRLY